MKHNRKGRNSPSAGDGVVYLSPEVRHATRREEDLFHRYPPPFDLVSDMLFVIAVCPVTPLRQHFPGVPFLSIAGKAVLVMWFSRIKELWYHPKAGTARSSRNREGVPYNELSVITLLKRRGVFVPGIYATTNLSLALGHRYGMPKQVTRMSFEAQGAEIRSRRTDGQRESFVHAKILTSGSWLGKLASYLLPLWVWPAVFPSGSWIRAFIQDVPRAHLVYIRSGQLAPGEPWLPHPVKLLPFGVFVPGQRMRLPAPRG